MKTKIVPITIDVLYINEHSKNRTQINISDNTTILSNIVKQIGKNGKEIEFNRVVIPYNDNYNIIMNLYQSKTTQTFYGKVLTVLTNAQLKTSRNMNCGRPEDYQIRLTIKKSNNEDKFFEYKDYLDYLNQISE